MYTPYKISRLAKIRDQLKASECPINDSDRYILEEQFLYLHIYKQITSKNKHKTNKTIKIIERINNLRNLLNDNHVVNVDNWNNTRQITEDFNRLVFELENSRHFSMLVYKPKTHLVALIESLVEPGPKSAKPKYTMTMEQKRALGTYLLDYIRIREDKNNYNKSLKLMKLAKETYAIHLERYENDKDKIARERELFLGFVDQNLGAYIEREKIRNKTAFFYEREGDKRP